MNGYRVTAIRLADSWTITGTKAIQPDPADRVVLTDPLSFSWQFVDQLAPNPLEPEQLGISLAARDRADLPTLDTGDLWHVTVELVDVTDGVVTPHGAVAVDFVGRLGEPELELVPDHSWPIRASLRMTDLTADLASRYPTPGNTTPWPAEGWSDVSPEWFTGFIDHPCRREFNLWTHDDMGDPNDFDNRPFLVWDIPQQSARWLLDAAGASVPHDGQPFIIRDRYSLAPPAPSTFTPAGTGGVPDPTNPIGYLYQRVNGMPPTALLPYVLDGPPAGPITVLLDYDPAQAVGLAGIPASTVTIPTKARRARDLVPNTTILNGFGINYTDVNGTLTAETTQTSKTFSSDWAAPRSRSVDTLIKYLRATAGEGVTLPAGFTEYFAGLDDVNTRLLAPAYTPDAGATTAEWAYDSLIVDTSLLDPDEFAALVPMFTSWSPEQGDGVALRPIHVFDVADNVDLSGRQAINGTLTGATLRIDRGRMTYELNVSPGIAPSEATGTAITAAQLAASPYTSAPATAFGDLTALDMRLVRA